MKSIFKFGLLVVLAFITIINDVVNQMIVPIIVMVVLGYGLKMVLLVSVFVGMLNALFMMAFNSIKENTVFKGI